MDLPNGHISYNKPPLSNGTYEPGTYINLQCHYGYIGQGYTGTYCNGYTGKWNVGDGHLLTCTGHDSFISDITDTS